MDQTSRLLEAVLTPTPTLEVSLTQPNPAGLILNLFLAVDQLGAVIWLLISINKSAVSAEHAPPL